MGSSSEGAGADRSTAGPDPSTVDADPATAGHDPSTVRADPAAAVAPPPFFPVALAIFGVCDAIAPYVSNALGLTLYTQPVNEVVDHVIPGAIVILVAWLSLIRRQHWLGGDLVAMVAGTWMVATHVPLLVQAANGQVDMTTALIHSIPGILVFLTAAAMTATALIDSAAARRPV
jgi:hypothetical protein